MSAITNCCHERHVARDFEPNQSNIHGFVVRASPSSFPRAEQPGKDGVVSLGLKSRCHGPHQDTAYKGAGRRFPCDCLRLHRSAGRLRTDSAIALSHQKSPFCSASDRRSTISPPFALERLAVIRGADGGIARVRYVLPRHWVTIWAATWIGPGRGRKSTPPGATGVCAPNHKLRQAATALAKR